MLPSSSILSDTISTYGFFMVLSLAAAYGIGYIRVRRSGLNTDHLLIIASMTLLGILIGAKLFYVLITYSPAELLWQLRSGDFSAWYGGGLVFYGGLIGSLPGAWLGARIAGTRMQAYVHSVTPGIPFAHAIGRIGCFFAGCCYGVAYDGPFAVHYDIATETGVCSISVLPVQLLEAAANIGIGFSLLVLSKKRQITLPMYILPYAVCRFLLEFLRGDAARGTLWLFSSSQWISLALIAACIVYEYLHKQRRKKK